MILVLVSVKTLTDQGAKLFPLCNTTFAFNRMEPRCCRAREIERGETGFQRLANSINLKKHFTPIPPYAWVFTIKLREIKFGQGTRSRHRALGSRYELMMNRGMRKRRFRPNGGKVVQGHTRDRVWRMGSENPTANIPVVVDNAVPAGPLRG